MARHVFSTVLMGIVVGTLVGAPSISAACSSTCSIGSCEITCSGNAVNICGCYAGLLPACSCDALTAFSSSATVEVSTDQGLNGAKVVKYLLNLGTPEGNQLAALAQNVNFALTAQEGADYAAAAILFKNALQTANPRTLVGFLDATRLLAPPLECDSPRTTEVDVKVDGSVKHEVSGCAVSNRMTSTFGAFSLLLVALAWFGRRARGKRIDCGH